MHNWIVGSLSHGTRTTDKLLLPFYLTIDVLHNPVRHGDSLKALEAQGEDNLGARGESRFRCLQQIPEGLRGCSGLATQPKRKEITETSRVFSNLAPGRLSLDESLDKNEKLG